MKKAFVIVCDVMVVAVCIALGAALAWIVMSIAGWSSAAAGSLTIAGVSGIVAAVLFVASYIIWRHGGAPEGIDLMTDTETEEDIDE